MNVADESRYYSAKHRKLVVREDDPNQLTSWLATEDILFSNVSGKRTTQSRTGNQDARNNVQKTAFSAISATTRHALVW